MSKHFDAYRRLAMSVEDVTPTNVLSTARGCKVVSEVFRAR
jgi:hypothetical protein